MQICYPKFKLKLKLLKWWTPQGTICTSSSRICLTLEKTRPGPSMVHHRADVNASENGKNLTWFRRRWDLKKACRELKMKQTTICFVLRLGIRTCKQMLYLTEVDLQSQVINLWPQQVDFLTQVRHLSGVDNSFQPTHWFPTCQPSATLVLWETLLTCLISSRWWPSQPGLPSNSYVRMRPPEARL